MRFVVKWVVWLPDEYFYCVAIVPVWLLNYSHGEPFFGAPRHFTLRSGIRGKTNEKMNDTLLLPLGSSSSSLGGWGPHRQPAYKKASPLALTLAFSGVTHAPILEPPSSATRPPGRPDWEQQRRQSWSETRLSPVSSSTACFWWSRCTP